MPSRIFCTFFQDLHVTIDGPIDGQSEIVLDAFGGLRGFCLIFGSARCVGLGTIQPTGMQGVWIGGACRRGGDGIPDGDDRLKFRVAKSQADVDLVLPLARELHEDSRFAEIPFSQDKCQRGLMRAIKAPASHGLLMAVKAQEPVGFLYCTAGEFMAGTGSLIVTVHTFCVSRRWRGTAPGGRAALGLLNGAVRWAKARQAREIMIHVTSGIDIRRTDRFLCRAGFVTIGANYALGLAGEDRS